MFDQSIQMPMLIRWPAQVEAGSRIEAIITNVDIAATFLDACGIEATEELPTSQGRSFLPLLRGETVEGWPDAAYYRYWEDSWIGNGGFRTVERRGTTRA